VIALRPTKKDKTLNARPTRTPVNPANIRHKKGATMEIIIKMRRNILFRS
jgi:hypothetical protein